MSVVTAARGAARKARVAVLISGRGSNMEALVRAAADPAYPARIVAVVSNRADAAGLAIADATGIATHVLSHRGFASREAFDAALGDLLDDIAPDLVCLAGFMRILGADLVARWSGRMLNVHPSLLPAFRGLDTHARALAAGVKIHGCTVHLVTAELDDGPILMQAAVPVMEDDTADSLAARVLAQEHVIYPAALARFVTEHLAPDGAAGPSACPTPPSTPPVFVWPSLPDRC